MRGVLLEARVGLVGAAGRPAALHLFRLFGRVVLQVVGQRVQGSRVRVVLLHLR